MWRKGSELLCIRLPRLPLNSAQSRAPLFSRTYNSPMDIPLTLKRASLAAAMLTLCGSAAAQGQTALLADGTTLSIKFPLAEFTTEGAIFDLIPQTKQIFVTGIGVTIPTSVDGVAVVIHGTGDGGTLDANGVVIAGTVHGIEAHNFDRLLDENAIAGGRSIGNASDINFTGAARSIFSTDRFLMNHPLNSAVQVKMFDQFNAHRDGAYLGHAGVLTPPPAVPNALPLNYPSMSGGTCKSAGHVYLDSVGNEYYIPDLGIVIELSENVVGGLVRSVSQPIVNSSGVTVERGSMVVGDMMIMLNQDPRFTADSLGLGGSTIPSEVMWANLEVGSAVIVVGHMIGEDFMYGQLIETDAVDVGAPPQISAEQWLFTDAANRIRFRGFLDKPFVLDNAGNNTTTLMSLHVAFKDAAGLTLLDRLEELTIDPLTGVGQYRVRSRDEVNVADVAQIERYATNPISGLEVIRTVWMRIDVE